MHKARIKLYTERTIKATGEAIKVHSPVLCFQIGIWSWIVADTHTHTLILRHDSQLVVSLIIIAWFLPFIFPSCDVLCFCVVLVCALLATMNLMCTTIKTLLTHSDVLLHATSQRKSNFIQERPKKLTLISIYFWWVLWMYCVWQSQCEMNASNIIVKIKTSNVFTQFFFFFECANNTLDFISIPIFV